MRRLLAILYCGIIAAVVHAQSTLIIGGNVYGGGNNGDTGGSSKVNIYGGDIHHVYGGACRADIEGSAFVHIDGEHASSYIIIDKVYGGNDIAGTIGSSAELPTELSQVGTGEGQNNIDNSWNVFVRISDKEGQKTFIGQLFGGGNGDYAYSSRKPNGKYDVTIEDTTYEDVVKPEVGKTYLEVLGGSINYAYGGGNNVTITDSTVICFDNPSDVVTRIEDANGVELLTDDRFRNRMGLNLAYSFPSSDAFQVGRFYGGNNKAEMAIRPTWNLKSGKIRNLYSGGNCGDMTSPYGLLLEIPDTSTIKVDNLYGGCRMADVKPTVNGEYKPVANLPGYNFPPELSARVLVRGGDVNNVYGGNDITGRVYGGSAVGIYTSVRGDVYGGGNGSYAYTDNSKLASSETYGDLYYTVPAGKTSVEALNDFRPNAEQVSIRLAGDDALHPTIIGGSVYCGGNSASLKTNKSKPKVELKLGSYVIAENVFLGNNGENIIKYNEKDKDETGADDPGAPEGVLYTMQRTDIPELEGTKFNSLNLETPATFEAYMQGVAMPLLPNVVFDDETKGDPETYIPYTALIGSFFCGGNVGSMSAPGTIDLDDVNTVRIYNKFVAGCKDAYVPAHTDFNAAYNGGFTVESHPKINVNLNGLKLCPLKLERDGEGKPTGLAWNLDNTTYSTKRYVGANIYGGCYNSGHINGDVVININESTVNKQKLFEDTKFNIFGEDTDVQLDNADVSFDEQREEIFITSLGIFGAGYGLDSEIWGSTTLNFNNGYNFLVFGGGEKGAVGKKEEGVYTYNPDYSTYVNLKGANAGTADGTDIPAAEYIYAGGFEGLVAGDTYMNLGNGRVNASFGGACNADILGHAETIIGKGGYPYVVEDVYGANDLGGRIRGEADFKSKVREGARALMHNGGAPATASAYVEYLQGRVRNIFGGCYGKYEYSAITTPTPIAPYQGTINVDVDGYVRQVLAPYIPNAFVYVHPEQNVNNSVAGIFGAGEGDTNYQEDENGILQPNGSDPIGDMLQDRSYVLVDIPEGYLNLKSTDIYGAGSYNGVGMWIPKATADAPATADQASAIVDLISGDISAAHGGGYEEGLTRRTVVNVPEGSIVKADKIFGGAEGTSVHKVCDVYESHVNYNSETATAGTLYGGNDAFRQTLYAHVDVTTPVWSDKAKGYKATVYGSGYGLDTWANYTEVNLKDGAIVYEVYGGGEMGRVANIATAARVAEASGSSLLDLPNGYGDGDHHATGLADAMAKVRLDGLKHNTNVLIHKGATVENYAYGGGRGYDDENFGDGDVNGTTYIALMGGTVKKDIYAAGTIGAVLDEFGNLTDYRDEPFVADATAYIAGGSTRNVYGGGWKGSVGKHKKQEGDVWVDAAISDIPDGTTVIDIPGTTHVYVGIRNDQRDASKLAAVQAVLGESATLSDYGFYAGVPTVQRNVYGGGEGGAVFGTTNVEQNYGYIGYVYNESEDKYEEKLDDETWTDHVGKNRLLGSGNIFGGGYIDNSSVDSTNVKMYGGYVRNSLFGGGEIAAIGRGDVTVGGYQNSERTLNQIYKYGKTQVELINGNVLRDVFAGGKGYDNLGRVGTLYTDGYVFGQTEAHVHGGIVGTAENYDEGYGNVFGGGDLGYVYGKGHRDTVHPGPSPDHYYYVDGEGNWTEDCKVVVEPWAQVKAGQSVTVDGTSYSEYDYVPTDKLNKLKGKNDDVDKDIWAKLDDAGIIIRNAVFGGGNVADGSEKVYANTKTVFGNVTAAVRDVYRRDLITIGTEHVGGLYGGGNLSLVDGYRELHIANYGTDYYGLQQEISMDQYNNLTDRERAYFRLRYTCKKTYPGGKDAQGITYVGHSVGEQIFDEEYNMLPEGFKTGEYWSQDGVCSIYAGRLLNTLQRADLVGVLGSRMVLQGAPDRVTDVQDKQNYTINRIGELSLKKATSPIGETDPTNSEHGNYFGIYSMVNYLGNLTSDVLMSETRTTDSSDADGKSYHDWKAYNKTNKKRNTATCHNQVALASGVFLELVNEPGRVGAPAEGKDYGYITGVVELDLINAKADAIGGGYVYAKNEHGARSDSGETLTTLSPYNTSAGLRTYRMYTYNENSLEDIQTSGNFIHGKKKTIIDDCYPHNLEYTPGTAKYSTAHYWYIKGSIYIYDQIINAYTGSPTAYTRETHIPVTITAGAHGVLKLVDIKQNKYAYFDTDGNPLGASDTIKVNNNSVSFGRNDVISYWDWSQLPATERALFVDTTYVRIVENEVTAVALEPGEGTGWHMSNNISHNTGYVLDFKMDTPPAWNTWYSEIEGTDSASTARYDGMDASTKARYIPGPTYSTSEGGVFGQRTYTVGELVPDDVVTKYSDPHTGDQATIEVAYVASEAVSYTYDSTPKSVSAGTPIPYSEWNAITDATVKNKFGTAKMCISTLRLNEQTYIVYGDLLNATDIATLKTAFPSQTAAIDAALTPAHVCSAEGLYGGTSYTAGNKYDAIKGWAALTSGDRAQNKFSFNYDGLDVLIDPTYSGNLNLYHSPYKDPQYVEYVAIYNSDTPYISPAAELGRTINKGDTLSRDDYEHLWNEKYHYTAVVVSTTESTGDDYYIAKKDFARGNIAYAKGQVIPSGTYRALSADERTELIEVIKFTNLTENPVTYYYCREGYQGQTSVTNRNDSGIVDTGDHGTGTDVEAGWVIDADDFGDLKNNQLNYLIKGEEPTESSTLYVSRESNIEDLSKEKIISVMYQYTYNESGDDGDDANLVNEMHIVNVHIKFESGAPIIEPLLPPATVLPGTTVGMNQPKVTPGAYELIGGGWEIYSNETDANLHRNGQEYINNNTPMYWYQDDYYVSYYAKSYMGKTYSNPVQFSVANYHDLKTVLEAKEHHYYIDHQDAHIGGKKRRPKIYINDYSATSENGLDLLKNLYDLSLITKSTPGTTFNGDTIKSGTFNGHLLLNSRVAGANDLDIIFRTNIRHDAQWTSIGDETHCFGGNIHGDGHYVSALDHSLFGKLCGHVYNLGVMGTFTGGGIADVADNSGSAENCWIKTSGIPAVDTKAVIGSYSSNDQVKNCYYPGNEAFTLGAAMKASKTDFYYGDVAYRLNRFYLLKRYNLNRGGQEVATDTTYVTDRYGNPDFLYADGTIPEEVNTDRELKTPSGDPAKDPTTGEQLYVPLYPYDYLFFGQALNYGHLDALAHQDVPSPIVKEEDVVETGDTGNRVYRAPAYFRNSTMSKVYFNPYAVFAKTNAAESEVIHQGLTAVDFTGYDDAFNPATTPVTAKSYYNGTEDGKFFPPLLDIDEVSHISNYGLTKNLLVYTEEAETGDEASVAGKTGRAVQLSLGEPSYDVVGDYCTVAAQDESSVNGHWVYRDAGEITYSASNDHLLIDRNDFWAPIGYEFDGSSRMWYQRTPDTFAGLNTGWESVVLPFTVQMVSTHQKGEITHFYGNDIDGKIGHEYWLRKYTAIETGDEANTMKATFTRPAKNEGADAYDKVYTNTFLWHELHEGLSDGQNQYYKTEHTYEDYPLQQQATPYIIGFPGKDFYEFDLSGQWTAAARPTGFDRQTVTFASHTGATIRQSNDDMDGVTYGNYTFTPSYLNEEIAAGTQNYVMAADGSKYVKVPATGDATPILPFRAYFAKTGNSGDAISILFTDAEGMPEVAPEENPEPEITPQGEVKRGITFTPGVGTITAKSTLDEPRVILVYGVNGALVKAFDIRPNSTVTIHVPSGLVYAIRTVSGDYSSKLLVR